MFELTRVTSFLFRILGKDVPDASFSQVYIYIYIYYTHTHTYIYIYMQNIAISRRLNFHSLVSCILTSITHVRDLDAGPSGA